MNASATTQAADDRFEGLAPVWRSDARLLVLGSMPGRRSLLEQAYYAHPRNAFWAIAEALFGVPADAPYPDRLDGLREAGVALWDVIARCRRRGSLDQAIDAASVEPNRIDELLQRCPAIEVIAFNGAAAEAVFRRHVLPTLASRAAAIRRLRLPSTSPAHAALRLEKKIECWRAALLPLLPSRPDRRP